MKELPDTPWPSLIKVALIIGCTLTFCILGLVAGVLAVTAMQDAHGLLPVILVPPAAGAVFGFLVGLVSASLVRWKRRTPMDKPPLVGPRG
jgi:cation transporter-like permease